MNDRDIKGITTELECEKEFIRRGYMVSIPISQSSKYDFIVDINSRLIRIQVKYSRKSKTGFSFGLKSVHLNSKGAVVHKYTQDDIDYICTYFDNSCYMIPIREVENRTDITLSIDNTWVNAHHLMIADDYKIDRQIDKLINGDKRNDQIIYKIQQLTKDGALIEEQSSVSDFNICKDDMSKQAHISECINNKRKSAYGYIWKRIAFKEE